jgi:hypothetical protein
VIATEESPRDLLQAQAEREVTVETASARERDPEQAEIAHRADDLERNRASVKLLGLRRDHVLGEPADRLLELGLLPGEIEVHLVTSSRGRAP